MSYRAVFKSKPEPVSTDTRLAYNIFLISIALGKFSRGKKSSLSRLQAIVWCAKAPDRLEKLHGSIISGGSAVSWPVDPIVYRVVELMVGEGLVSCNGKVVSILDKGLQLIGHTDKSEVLQVEEERMRLLSKALTEGYVENCLKAWGSNENQ